MNPASCASPALYVATNLSCWRTPHPEQYRGDVWAAGWCHRELAPVYYAWLQWRVSLAREAGVRGGLPAETVADLEARFAEITAYATERFGAETLEEAARSPELHKYRPPKLRLADWLEEAFGDEPRNDPVPQGHCFPAAGDWPFHEPVSTDAVEQVDAVREEAIALGWSEPSLYQNRSLYRFPCGQDYGLVCFLSRGRSVESVDAQAVAIRTRGGHLLRFRKLDRSKAEEIADTSGPAPVCNSRGIVP
jgi:hypothetical protein